MENQPKVVTEKDLAEFRKHTNTMIGLMVGLLFWTLPFCAIMVWLYKSERDRKYELLLMEYNRSFDQRELNLLNEGYERAVKYNRQQFIDNSNYLMAGKPFLCRTCQQNYPNPGHEKITLCWNLRTVFPHDPHAAPPKDNPYKWYWFQINGYPMPPDNWPTDKVWMPESAGEGDPVAAMTAEGKKYYQTHPNHMWDRGKGSPPAWYYLKETV